MIKAPSRRLGALALVVGALAALILGLASPASAHAVLIGSDPAEGAILESAPEQVSLTFSEAVRAMPEGIQVFDALGTLVDATATARGAKLSIALDEPLAEGTTVIVWRVVSEDGHPIGGSLTFSVGAPTTDFTPPPVETAASGQVPLTLTLVRWLGYLGLFLVVGLVAFVLLVLLVVPADAVGGQVSRRLTTTARASGALTVVAWLAGLPLTAAYVVDGGIRSLGRSTTWSSLQPVEVAVPIVVIVGVALAVGLLGRGAPSPARRVAALAAAVVAVGAPAFTGHTRAATPEALAVGTDVLHLVAGSVWLGGLVGLVLVLPVLNGRGGLAAEVLARFSTAAAGVLAALVVTGVVLGWRILGSWSGLVETTYGKLLLVKVGFVCVAVAMAAWNRWSLLPRLKSAAQQDGSRVLRRTTAIEAIILVAVLILSSFLVDKNPEGDAPSARTASATEPGAQIATLGEIEVGASITPLSQGPNTLTIKLTTAAGEPTEGVAPPVIRLTSGAVDLGDIPLMPVSVGLYSAQVVLPAPGTWTMQVSLRVSEFANPVKELTFEVAG